MQYATKKNELYNISMKLTKLRTSVSCDAEIYVVPEKENMLLRMHNSGYCCNDMR